MKTRRLYWEAPYRRRFRANVIESGSQGGRPTVVLDATCFYPTSGGQPHDTGTLGEAHVVEVIECDGEIVHYLDRPLPVGRVKGVICWERRYDHMQQHTGQHILSRAFERVLGANTVSFHLGEFYSTIDLDLTRLDREQVAQVEDLCNQIVMEGRRVTTRIYAADQIGSLGLRRPPKESERIRVVEIADFDRCACGGTHVASTSEVGPIHVMRWESNRGQVRVTFLCGWRALRRLRQDAWICQDLGLQLSVGIDELPAAVQRLLTAEQEARNLSERMQRRWLEGMVETLVQQTCSAGEARLLCRVLEGVDAGAMRYVAQQLVQHPKMVVVLATAHPSPQYCFARSQDLEIDMPTLLREVVTPHGGKGGGRPHVAQGGGVPQEALSSIVEAAKERLYALLQASH